MAKAFKEMDFEWEFLHPKGSLLTEEDHSLGNNCMIQPLAPIADEELSDEPVAGTEEICQEQAQIFHKKLPTDEAVDFEEPMAFEAGDEDVYDWGLKDLFIKEEEEEPGKAVECTADSCNAFSLTKWLRTIGVAAATLSIFMLGGGSAQLIGNNQKIQLPMMDEKIKDSVQHKRATSPSFSWCGYYDERF